MYRTCLITSTAVTVTHMVLQLVYKEFKQINNKYWSCKPIRAAETGFEHTTFNSKIHMTIGPRIYMKPVHWSSSSQTEKEGYFVVHFKFYCSIY